MRRGFLAPVTVALLAAAWPMRASRDAAARGPAPREPRLAQPALRTDAASGLELVRLPGGTFHFGCEPADVDCSDDERPGRTVTVEPMWLGKTEVTVDAYARCVTAGACTQPAKDGACNWGVAERVRHPVNCVDWSQAAAFCQWMGGALPTAEQWEYAAKSGESRIYPWGNDPPTDRLANFADSQYKRKFPRAFEVPGQDDGWVETAPVGSFPAGASKQGLLDLSGNVIEWTASEYEPGLMEARGGGWATDTVSRRLRASYRTSRERSFWHATYGFRCRVAS
jgi:formylglycine-generating enzyme required for sulfatase activity